MTLVSGYEFYKLCKWSYCPRYESQFNPQLIQENDLVFLNLDYFIQFISALQQNNPKHKFILITHNSDKPFTIQHFSYLFNFTNHIFAINCLINHPKITCLPIGFVDNKYKPRNKFEEILNKNYNKEILLYCNFSIETNRIKRIECLNKFLNEKWVLKEKNLPPEEFYKKIARSKYVLSPEGTGIDCNRIYESIYFNSIPIIKKTQMDYFYTKISILIVNDWSDVTKEFLETNYESHLNKLIEWKRNNEEWITAKYWLGIKN